MRTRRSGRALRAGRSNKALIALYTLRAGRAVVALDTLRACWTSGSGHG